ncbi:hypothetical protein ITJ66_09550 [Plantibacter sp. VKM Ac-2885]|uniref:hypothetical protein n=1 Tax=Plantibacter TaxID=190323 RepID=UPI00188AB618|nr:hypothetical protein [Plantibacter sp. VKM Ac-2885]MBF4512729.1 hypothetical protein [Plantibacter sp. VKM Ac-2885]
MSTTLQLLDATSLADLRTFLARAARIDDSGVRLLAIGDVLAVSAPVLHPQGLLDRSPTIIGMRTFALAEPATADVLATPRELIDRIVRTLGGVAAEDLVADARETVPLELPPSTRTAPWVGQAPPRGGWERAGDVDTIELELVARTGASEIAETLPTAVGDQIVQKVRSQVWSRPLGDGHGLPTGAAFAAVGLGFIAEPERAAVFRSGGWVRLSTRRGHVLAGAVS